MYRPATTNRTQPTYFLSQENATLLWDVVQSNELIQTRYAATPEQRLVVSQTFDRLFPAFSAAEMDHGLSLLDMNKKFILTLITELNTQYNRGVGQGVGTGTMIQRATMTRKPEVLQEAWEKRQQAYQTELVRAVPPTPVFADAEAESASIPLPEDQLDRRMKQTMAEREQDWERLRRTLPSPTPPTQAAAPTSGGILKRIRIQEEEAATPVAVQLPEPKHLSWADEVPARVQALEERVVLLTRALEEMENRITVSLPLSSFPSSAMTTSTSTEDRVV